MTSSTQSSYWWPSVESGAAPAHAGVDGATALRVCRVSPLGRRTAGAATVYGEPVESPHCDRAALLLVVDVLAIVPHGNCTVPTVTGDRPQDPPHAQFPWSRQALCKRRYSVRCRCQQVAGAILEVGFGIVSAGPEMPGRALGAAERRPELSTTGAAS